MNKFLLWSGIAVLAIASCAKDQTTEVNNGHAIGFRAGTETKASPMETYQLTSFYCTAVDAAGANFFTDAGFARSGEYFSSSPAYYWPSDGSELNFWAYSPSSTAMGVTTSINKDQQVISGFQPAEKFEDQVDLITATATGSKANEGTGVPLTFGHRLAQISVSAKNSNTEYIYKVYGLRVVNFQTNGTFNFADNKWSFATPSVEKATCSTMFDAPVTLQTYYDDLTSDRIELENDDWDYVYNTAMIIPQTLVAWNPDTDPTNTAGGAYLSIAIQITTKDGDLIFPENGEYGYVATPLDIELAAGYDHHINLDFTNGAGYLDPEFGGPGSALGSTVKFTMKMNPWEAPEGGEILRRQLEGSWKARRVVVTYTYPENVPEEYRTPSYEYTTPEGVKQFFGGNGFYEFTVDNNYMIHMTTPEGVKTESAMTVDEDGNVYLEAFEDSNEESGYMIIPVIQDVDDVNHTAITYVDETYSNWWNEWDEDNGDWIRHNYNYIRRNTFYYDKF